MNRTYPCMMPSKPRAARESPIPKCAPTVNLARTSIRFPLFPSIAKYLVLLAGLETSCKSGAKVRCRDRHSIWTIATGNTI